MATHSLVDSTIQALKIQDHPDCPGCAQHRSALRDIVVHIGSLFDGVSKLVAVVVKLPMSYKEKAQFAVLQGEMRDSADELIRHVT